MKRIILDTDVASSSLKGKLVKTLTAQLVGAQLGVTFVTLGEFDQVGCIADWGPRNREKLAAGRRSSPISHATRRHASANGALLWPGPDSKDGAIVADVYRSSECRPHGPPPCGRCGSMSHLAVTWVEVAKPGDETKTWTPKVHCRNGSCPSNSNSNSNSNRLHFG